MAGGGGNIKWVLRVAGMVVDDLGEVQLNHQLTGLSPCFGSLRCLIFRSRRDDSVRDWADLPFLNPTNNDIMLPQGNSFHMTSLLPDVTHNVELHTG